MRINPNPNTNDLNDFVQDLPPRLFPTSSAGAFHLAGFSFGGRAALHFAASELPTRPRILSLHVTGVSATRDAHARAILTAWSGMLESDGVEEEILIAFGHDIIRRSHSPEFLAKNAARIDTWVNLVVASNTVLGVGNIIRQSHSTTLSVAELVERVHCHARFITGEHDELCGASSNVEDGMKAFKSATVVKNSGHAVPLEQPKIWRDDLLSFIKENSTHTV